jgi:hypothetical protein
MTQALQRAVTDVQDIGSGLGAAGATVAKGTVRLAYDVGALAGIAGATVFTGTVAVARDLVRRAEALFSAPPAPPADIRKPLRRASGVARKPIAEPAPSAQATAPA